MKLKRLRIVNCSRISDVDIEVRDNLVLIGPNGSGKTTVLQCIDMLLGMNAHILHATLSADYIRDASRPMTVQAVLEDLDDAELVQLSGKAGDQLSSPLPIRLDVSVESGDIAIERSFSIRDEGHGASSMEKTSSGWTLMRSPADGERARFAATMRDALRKDRGILAIDEPEAHLHPSSQRSLAKRLKSSACQKILVTHSPTIAGSFEPDEIVVIRADGTAVQPARDFLSGNVGMLARWWIGRQLEPLTAGAVIAVEGPSDRLIVDKVASATGFDLDRNDVVVVETNGCGDMKVVESIFGDGGFGIPLYELIDADASDEAARRLDVDESQLEACSVFVSLRDLEDEYVRAIGAKKLWDKIRTANTFSKTVLSLCKLGRDGYPSERDLAQFIREKSNRKIPSALVAAGLIDEANAPKVKSVARLLQACRQDLN